MAQPIDFYFDFSSPYAYLASVMIEPVAEKHGRQVNWHSFMLGVAFKGENTGPLTVYPKKGEYSRLDFDRTARKYGIPFNMPEEFPKITLAASRAFFWLSSQGNEKAVPFAKAVFAAYFVDGQDVSDPQIVKQIGARIGLDPEELQTVFSSDDVKAAYKASVEDIVENKKVFGAPYMIVDGEPFWGADRVVQVDEWLQTGGW
ncbi:MAG: 2-hydroxychromene-2-carboxylate isomerase [Sneathiellales bacterium]|nr:2-hydroxychromene-2-carboxylate isomerase [Sneathiellales bacterium]